MALDPMLQRAESYVGRPYIEAEFDCADLAVLVQHEVFGRAIALPSGRRRPLGVLGQAREIRRWRDELADRIDTPETGCGVLGFEPDRDGSPMWHIGTVFVTAEDTWVLHNSYAMGSALLQRLSDLRRQGMRLEGFYRWRTAA